jgi:hypothetical protein
VWGDHIVWGDLVQVSFAVWSDHIVWGDGLLETRGNHIVWGDPSPISD